MNKTIATLLTAATTSTIGLVGGPLVAHAAPVAHPKYYACLAGGYLSKVSFAAHACPKPAKVVTGNFAGANFTYANLAGAMLNGVNLAKTNLSGVTSGHIVGVPSALPKGWMLVKGFLIGPSANLASANLTGLNLTKVNATGATFYGANLTNVNFSGANLTNASLSNATITGAIFATATMKGTISAYENGQPASLPTGWQLSTGQFDGNNISYLVGPLASIGGAHLSGLTFAGVNLDGIYMAGDNLVATSFNGASLVKATLASADLQEVDFTNANASGGNFQNADFEGANLTNANFSNTNLNGARLLSVAGIATANFTGATCPDGVIYGQLGANC